MALLERGESDVVGGNDIPMAAQSRPLKFDFFSVFFLPVVAATTDTFCDDDGDHGYELLFPNFNLGYG